jgi:hypothetical protein
VFVRVAVPAASARTSSRFTDKTLTLQERERMMKREKNDMANKKGEEMLEHNLGSKPAKSVVVWLGFIVFCLVCPGAYAEEFPMLEGQLSEVRIVEIGRISTQRLVGKEPAEDGVVFVFRVDRKPGVLGPFSLVELRRFRVNDTDYPSKRLTTQADGETSDDWKFLPPKAKSPPTTADPDEPHTVLLNWSDYIQEYRPDLAAHTCDLDDCDSLTMIVEIYCPRLPSAGQGIVTIDVGWGQVTEKFSYSFQVEHLPAAQTELTE